MVAILHTQASGDVWSGYLDKDNKPVESGSRISETAF